MQSHITGRGIALVAGALAAGGALAILLQDALRTWTWQLEHGLIPVLMAVQILTAHSVVNAARARRPVSVIGFAIVAAVATWGVLYTSVGKQSKVAAESIAVAEDVNDQRAQLDKALARNNAMLAQAQADLASECKSGKGRRCEGIAATVKVYADAVAGVEAKLAKLGPARPLAPNADKMAELIGFVTGGDQAKVKHVLLLLEPFTYATIFELAALVSFGFAFGHRRTVRAASVPAPPAVPVPGPRKPSRTVAGRGTVLQFPAVPNGSLCRTVRRFTKAEAVSDLTARLARGERFGSQDELRERYGVAKSTMSSWLSEWEGSGLVPERSIRGRCKVLAKA